MAENLSFSVLGIVVLMLGAIVLGITIHFFIVSRRNLKSASLNPASVSKPSDEWKLRYFNDIEQRDKELASLKEKLAEAEENSTIYSIEADEMRALNKKLHADMESILKTNQPKEKPGYIEQLRQAQNSLLEHNEKISQLLGQIDIVKETEEKQQEILKDNEVLSGQITELKSELVQKEKELHNVHQKEHLTREMTSMLDSAYNEFNVLQEKIGKLESQVNTSQRLNLDYEDLKEEHYKLTRDFQEQKIRYQATVSESQRMRTEWEESENRLQESELQRAQLQKRVAYLEELNNDMQAVSDANKKLENQLKRVGELESMLHVISEERDQLARRHVGS